MKEKREGRRDRQRDREKWVRQQQKVRERERRRERAIATTINEMRSPSVSAARRCSNILYFLMKSKEIKKENLVPLIC